MDKSIFFAILAAALPLTCSCIDRSLGVEPFKTRQEVLTGGGGAGRHGTYGGTSTAHRDTTIFVSGIDFPKEYDWRQDSLYGGIPARVVLLRGGERVLELPTGSAQHVSAQADMHHLVEGHLYTEYTDGTRTYIKLDGKDLYTFEGRESLRGILPMGTDLFTLAQKRSGSGFILRKGTTVVMERDEGVVQGTFGESGDGEYGALYEDDGHICFNYTRRLGSDGNKQAFYLVDNGLETQLYSDRSEVIGARVVGGDICKVCWSAASGLLTMDIGKHGYTLHSQNVGSVRDLTISDFGGQVLTTAAITFGKGSEYTCLWLDGVLQRAMPGRRMSFWDSDMLGFTLNGGDGILNIYNSVGTKVAEQKNGYLFNQNCGKLAGGRLFLAVTSRTDEAGQTVWRDGRATETGINGLLTGISVVVED